MNLLNLTPAQIRRVADIIEEREKLRLELLRALHAGYEAKRKYVRKLRHKMSAAGRANIARGQKRRWQRARAAKRNGRSFSMPASARIKLSQIAKARWAKAHAEGKHTL